MLTLIEQDAQKPTVRQGVLLYDSLLLVLELLPYSIEAFPRKLPMAALGRCPIICCHSQDDFKVIATVIYLKDEYVLN